MNNYTNDPIGHIIAYAIVILFVVFPLIGIICIP